jgi:hypothetical protein
MEDVLVTMVAQLKAARFAAALGDTTVFLAMLRAVKESLEAIEIEIEERTGVQL